MIAARPARRAVPAALLRAAGVLLVVAAPFLGGCGYSGGEMLYFLGFGRGKLIEAKFQLGEAPLLIFVDDFHNRLDFPDTKKHLTDHLAGELLRNKAAAKIVPFKTIQVVQQSDPDFAGRSCREIGERVGAERVLWIQVKDFLVTEEIRSTQDAAYMTTTVKVINVLEKKDRLKVRLWPRGRGGHPVTAGLSGSDVQRLKTKAAISDELTAKLAEAIAKLFYDHRLGDFEKEQ